MFSEFLTGFWAVRKVLWKSGAPPELFILPKGTVRRLSGFSLPIIHFLNWYFFTRDFFKSFRLYLYYSEVLDWALDCLGKCNLNFPSCHQAEELILAIRGVHFSSLSSIDSKGKKKDHRRLRKKIRNNSFLSLKQTTRPPPLSPHWCHEEEEDK